MPTTTSPTSAAPEKRQQLINDYIENDAMSTVLHVLIGNVPTGDSRYESYVYGPPWDGLIVINTDPYVEDGDRLLGELWPEDEDIEGAEYKAADLAGAALAAQLLAAIVANPDYLVRQAARLLEGVAARERKGCA